MQPTTSSIDSRTIVSYYPSNLAGFGNPFINGRGFIYLGILEMSLIFVCARVQGSTSIGTARKANINYTPIIAGGRNSRFKTLNLNVSGTERDVASKQR